KPYTILRQAAQLGPIVILNSHADGCDGIIMLSSSPVPVHVPLPTVTLEHLKIQQILLRNLLGRCNVRVRDQSVSTRLFAHRESFTLKGTQECFKEMLAWLWRHIAFPVYNVLKSVSDYTVSFSKLILSQHGIHNGRLWWLPTGEFTRLPLHACPPMDEFIHSYTPTLGSLLDAHAKNSSSIPFRVGVVGVTHTGSGKSRFLKGVEEEVERLTTIIKQPDVECLKGLQATVDAVMPLLQNCPWVHLACHGTQDLVNPTKSCLLLYEGELELETILQMPLPKAQFVFLAACQTAMGDAVLVNESFHLGGGFLAAGFRGAVGTLWSINDADGPLVADSFYSHLLQGGHQPQASDAAGALHQAMKKLKERGVPYERWVPFIHMG
ncbi:CHAT domain-containing protein, partial [Mycena leptocephala]